MPESSKNEAEVPVEPVVPADHHAGVPAHDAEFEAAVVDDAASGAGMRSLTADEFHPLDSIGGIRGLLESMLPGLVFVVAYVATRSLMTSLVASSAVALVAVVARLIQRTPVTQAFSGVLGVAIGVFWAWRSGNASDYYLPGLLINAAYLAVLAASIFVKWPIVGVVVEALRAGFTSAERIQSGATRGWSKWRHDPVALRRYSWATWLWVGLFGIRLAVQLPLYLADAVGWLGTARLVMGVPLWALVLWLTWILVRPQATHAAHTDPTIAR